MARAYGFDQLAERPDDLLPEQGPPIADQEVQVSAGIEELRKTDQRLADVLQMMMRQILARSIAEAVAAVQPVIEAGDEEEEAPPPQVEPPGAIAAGISADRRGIAVTWEESPTTDVTSYEVRTGTANDWRRGNFETRAFVNSALLLPRAAGNHWIMVRAINDENVYSSAHSAYLFTVNGPAGPDVQPHVVDNNVLVSWSEPNSDFLIDHYVTYREDVETGRTNGLVRPYLELSNGTYRYGVKAVDLAGNEGPVVTAETEVREPPDYELLSRRDVDLPLHAAGMACGYNSFTRRFYMGLSHQTWREHFASNQWTTIQDQLDAGFPLFLHPTSATEVACILSDYNYQTHFTSVLARVEFDSDWPYGQAAFRARWHVAPTEAELATVTPVYGKIVYAQNFQWMRFSFLINPGADRLAYLVASNGTITLDVKRATDQGVVDCLASDSDGTVVTFNKAFRDVTGAPQVTPISESAIIAVADFEDVPNPTGFKILCFDRDRRNSRRTPLRVNATVSWIARGII